MRVVNRQVPTAFRDVDVGSCCGPTCSSSRSAACSCRSGRSACARSLAGQLARSRRWTCRSGWPRCCRRAPTTGAGIERYMRDGPLGSRPHRRLPHARRTSSTSPPPTSTPASGSCSAPTDWDDVPISTAVRASGALPMVYKPVEVKDRELVDGGIVSTTNLDIAVEAGAKFVVVVNPLVPFVNDFEEEGADALRLARAPRVGHGLPADRLPVLQAPGLPATARAGAAVGGALPRRGHRADRARARRRADVPDERHELRLAGRHRAPRLRVRHAQAGQGLRALPGRSASATGSSISATRVRKVVKHFAAEKERRARGGRSSSRRRAPCCASPRGTRSSRGRSAAPGGGAPRPRGSGSPRAHARWRRRPRPAPRSRRRAAACRPAPGRSFPVRAATARWPG